ncbi:MAG: hypothetical protein WHX53_15265, partial [Anaerolineae bacterium]
DPQAAEMLHGLLIRLSKTPSVIEGELPRTIVTVTHSIERGLAIADRAVILVAGQIAFEGRTAGMTPASFRPLYDRYVGGGR